MNLQLAVLNFQNTLFYKEFLNARIITLNIFKVFLKTSKSVSIIVF